MDAVLPLASIAVAAMVAVALIALGRQGDPRPARIAVPLGAAVLLLHIALGEWSVAAFALLALMIAFAGALALRGRGREHLPTWIALAVFAAAGAVGGFGMLGTGLCAAGEAINCDGPARSLLAVGGWSVALTAYAYLAWGALRR